MLLLRDFEGPISACVSARLISQRATCRMFQHAAAQMRTAGAVDEQLLKMNRRLATKLSDNEHSVPSLPLMRCGGYYARSSGEAANKGSYF